MDDGRINRHREQKHESSFPVCYGMWKAWSHVWSQSLYRKRLLMKPIWWWHPWCLDWGEKCIGGLSFLFGWFGLDCELLLWLLRERCIAKIIFRSKLFSKKTHVIIKKTWKKAQVTIIPLKKWKKSENDDRFTLYTYITI
jgi:hypothetical protein